MTDKSNVGDLCNGILFSLAKEGNSDPGHHVDSPESKTLSAVCQPQKDKGCVTLLTGVQCGQAPGDRTQKRGCQGLWGGARGELVLTGDRVLVLQDERALERKGGNGSQRYEGTSDVVSQTAH